MKKVLFFTYDFPYPTNSGGKVRAYNLLKFASLGFEVTLFSFIRSGFKQSSINDVKKIGVQSVKTFSRPSVLNIKNAVTFFHPQSSIFKNLYFHSHVKNELINTIQQEKIDVIHFESLYTSYYISDELRSLGVKQIYGTENIESKNYNDYARKIPLMLNIPFQSQVKKIEKEEKKFAKIADITLAVTDEEAEYFFQAGAKKTAVIPNGVDIKEFAFKPSVRPEGKNLLFVGNFSYFPNREGINFFCREVLPKLSNDIHLTIIGRGSTKLKISDPRIEYIEYVADIRQAYYDADILISPIRIGGGTNFKIIEAASCGLPIVMHSSRYKSLEFTPDEDVLIADTAEEFIQKIELVLKNDELQGKLTKNARKHIEKKYSWEKIGKKLARVWEES